MSSVGGKGESLPFGVSLGLSLFMTASSKQTLVPCFLKLLETLNTAVGDGAVLFVSAAPLKTEHGGIE